MKLYVVIKLTLTWVLFWQSKQISLSATLLQLLCLLQWHSVVQLWPTYPKWHWPTSGATQSPCGSHLCLQSGLHLWLQTRQKVKLICPFISSCYMHNIFIMRKIAKKVSVPIIPYVSCFAFTSESYIQVCTIFAIITSMMIILTLIFRRTFPEGPGWRLSRHCQFVSCFLWKRITLYDCNQH